MKRGEVKNFLGFTSIADFTGSLFNVGDWATNGVFSGIAALITLISGYIYDSPDAVYTLWILMIIDWITGISRAIKFKELTSYKLFRMPLYFVATSVILSLSWWIAKGSPIFTLLPGIVLGGFYSVYFISLLENLSDLNLLPKQLVYVIEKRFGIKSIIDKYFKDDKEDKEEIEVRFNYEEKEKEEKEE